MSLICRAGLFLDEILEGGLPQGSTVQSWRGMDGAIEAAHTGNFAILSPTSHCYLDYGLESIDLEKIWSFNPIPPGLSQAQEKFIIGGEVNMWTEHVPNEATLDRQIMPRMIAMAEVLWNGPVKDTAAEAMAAAYDVFTQKLRTHYPYLDKKGVAYGFERVPIDFSSSFSEGALVLKREDKLDGIKAVYDANNSTPTILPDALVLQKDMDLSVQISQNGKDYPKSFDLSLAVHKALGHEPTSSADFSPFYTANGYGGLTDGFKGTLDFRDGRWQGYSGTDVVFEIDLGEEVLVSEVGAHFYQYNNAWIFPPSALQWRPEGQREVHSLAQCIYG